MHRIEFGEQKGIRNNLADLQHTKMKDLIEELQQDLGNPKRRRDVKKLLMNLDKKLELSGVSGGRFSEFLSKEVEIQFKLIVGQIKKEWVYALDNAEDVEKVVVLRGDIGKKADILDSIAKRGKEMLAVAYCLKDASGERGGAGRVFSKMSAAEVGIMFRRAEKEAEEYFEKLTKDEFSEVFKKIAFGV